MSLFSRWRNLTMEECLNGGDIADKLGNEVECGLEDGHSLYEPSPIVS